MPDTIDPKILASQYGFAWAFLKHNPELYKIFQQATGPESWSTDEFIAAVRNTKWFQSTADTAREWLLLKSSDPATAAERLTQRTSTMSTLASQLGIAATPAVLKQFALSSIMGGWDDTQTRKAMAMTYHFSASQTGKGLAATTVDDLHKIASDYVVPLSDHSIDHWTRQILAGTATSDDFKAYAEHQAKSLFPTLEGAINRGVSVAAYMDPYKQIAAQTLEMDPEAVDFMQAKWQRAINQVDNKGNRAPMSLADWATTLRTDPIYGYDKTQQAHTAATGLANSIAKTFGAMG